MFSHQNGVEITSAYALVWKTFANQPDNREAVFVSPGQRETVLFKESTMPLFITPEAREAASERLPNQKMWGATATRARFFRKALSAAVKKENIKQAILLGVGLDTTSVEKNKESYRGVKFFEVDKQPVLAHKARVYLNHGIDQNAEYIALDYVAEDLICALKDHGVDFSQPTMVLWEGNIFYLTNEQVLAVLRQLSTHFSSLRIAFDFMHTREAVETSRDLVAALTGFEKAKSPFQSFFDPDALIQVCETMQLRCVERKTGADLAREYEVDQAPYPTTEPYSLAVFHKK